ncbi:hypothetical protein Q7P36_009395 [Cladosporium allicinum]
MRDRRNTNLSTSSAGSTLSSASVPSRSSLDEKRYAASPSSEDGLLPLPVTKENPSRQLPRRTLVLRSLVALFALVWLVHWGMSCSMLVNETISSTTPSALDSIATHDLPSEPTALMVVDGAGAQKWTVSIPSDAPFPLKPGQYQDICTQSEALSSSFSQRSRLERVKDWRKKSAYYRDEPAYLDVAEAQRTGVLPGSQSTSNSTCASSITFSMTPDDVSFGKTLLTLWMSYGLAKKEGRAFFVDDSQWPYGSYASYFTPLPSTGCTPPPATQIVPCPHSAKHLIVSAATAQWTFGPDFSAEFATSRHGLVERGLHHHSRHRIYDLVRTGYEDLFHLFGDDAKYTSQRTHELQVISEISGHPTVAMQIRRGDLHPLEYEYSRDYLPLERYTAAANRLQQKLTVDDKSSFEPKSGDPPTLLLASDDPALPTHPDLLLAASPHPVSPAQTRILLATKAALDASSPANPIRAPGSAYVKHVDENAGWDGGFYPSLFSSLGGVVPASQEGGRAGVSDHVMRLRELIGRGYLLDLAVLGASDGVVCAVGSAGCRLVAVMMGWEAVAEGRWVNVDDGRGWSWDGKGR